MSFELREIGGEAAVEIAFGFTGEFFVELTEAAEVFNLDEDFEEVEDVGVVLEPVFLGDVFDVHGFDHIEF